VPFARSSSASVPRPSRSRELYPRPRRPEGGRRAPDLPGTRRTCSSHRSVRVARRGIGEALLTRHAGLFGTGVERRLPRIIDRHRGDWSRTPTRPRADRVDLRVAPGVCRVVNPVGAPVGDHVVVAGARRRPAGRRCRSRRARGGRRHRGRSRHRYRRGRGRRSRRQRYRSRNRHRGSRAHATRQDQDGPEEQRGDDGGQAAANEIHRPVVGRHAGALATALDRVTPSPRTGSSCA
jgi:hypothetical protein